MYDFLIVGAGLFGATCARVLTDAGWSVKVIERRNHIAGNCYDENWGGCYVNKYGGHIFHTNSRRIWGFVLKYTEMRHYEHRVKVNHRNRVYSFPPNLATYDQFNMRPGALADGLIRKLFFAPYTAKQWGRPIEQVPESVIKRIPFRRTYDDRYFDDRYQGVPEAGYTNMVQRMLEGVSLELEADYLADRDHWDKKAKKVIYSGPIDALFDYRLGRLAYRSLRHETERMNGDDFQGCATVNYPDIEIEFTRIMEWKHFGWRGLPKGETIITIEYPAADGEPYYPVEDDANRALYEQYAALAAEHKGLIVGGRLGSYRYYNMDQTIAQAIAISECQKGV